jgi:hypothetical protein
MAFIFEKTQSRRSTTGLDSPRGELLYVITGTEDEAETHTLVQATVPAYYGGLVFQSYDVEHQGAGVWDITALYGKRQPSGSGSGDPGGGGMPGTTDIVSFDTTGGTRHITQSRDTISSHAPGTAIAPDHKGAIGVTPDGVEGTDVVIPKFDWQYVKYWSPGSVGGAYLITLRELTGTVNGAPFKGMAKGECLFLGASGEDRAGESVPITYRFSYQKNESNVPVGDMTIPSVEGWQYLWVQYETQKEDASKSLVQRPKAAYVEKVYNYGDFSQLGIGV